MSEIFPPTEQELEEIIAGLKARLEDDSYQDEWSAINALLIEKEKQLQELIITNNTI